MNVIKIVVGGFKTESLVADKTNIKGIYCTDIKNPVPSWNVTVKHSDKYLNDSIPDTKKIMKNTDVGQFNAYKVSLINESDHLEGKIFDLSKKLVSLENNIYDVGNSVLDIKMTLLANATNETFASNDLKKTMQELNEFTKIKQSDISLKIKNCQQSFKLDKLKESIEETARKLQVLSKQLTSSPGYMNHDSKQQELKSASAGSESSTMTSILLLFLLVLIASLVIVLLVIYRNKLAIGSRKPSHYGTSNTLTTIEDNEI
ncbi:uncharacterized protein LOC131683628 [Topomyia yanbarensis]|uniref:uncharacterized protein LOC131683628 n=1 Tax=Topomyia yanbarensis TaxID=2498891 RepID=UPI00273C3F75|nr:uncharacterized protein LOC131683628 [Topomyia yanbarensis]